VPLLRQPAGLSRASTGPKGAPRCDRRLAFATCLVLAAAASFVRAQETPTPPTVLPPTQTAPPKPPVPKWSDSAELGFVATRGNSQTSTFGLKNSLVHEHDKSRFEIKLGGIRVVTTDKNIFAVGTATDFEGVDGDPKTTAESYYFNGRYDRKITDRFFWFAGAGWDRNEPAGIQNRTTVGAGVGNIWIDVPRRNWRTDYAVTGTKEDDVVEASPISTTHSPACGSRRSSRRNSARRTRGSTSTRRLSTRISTTPATGAST